jgi:isopenicillin N synthase-like dioxygenase
MSSHNSDLFSSFPDDVPTAPLVTINLQRLLNNDNEEHGRLFEASKSLGFFYLELSGCEAGETLLYGSDDMFNLIERFYAIPLEEKRKYDFAAEGSYFGYKGMGAEVIDGKGTRDRNEIYNVSYLFLHTPKPRLYSQYLTIS